MARIRRNILSLPAGDQTLYWYEKAVAAMQTKPIADPTSWRYQAAIHEYFREVDPLAKPSDVLPSQGEQDNYWSQCQHNSWFFLPWHRMYLHIFEQIVLAEIVKLGGPNDWALPYWNYSASANAALLPVAFRNSTLLGGGTNHLYVKDPDRSIDANSGLAFAQAADTDISGCLKTPIFAGAGTGGTAGFGGPVTAFHHGGGQFGAVDLTPHGTMHMAIAKDTGWMSNFYTAALDPIFWIHHCNIDRLWEVWLKRDASHKNPTTSNWLTKIRFRFRDAKGTAIEMVPAQVLDTTAAPLEYAYDDTSDPLSIPTTRTAGAVLATAARRGGAEPSIFDAVRGGDMAEMIGATSDGFRLDKTVVETPIALTKPTGPTAPAFEAFRALASARVDEPRVPPPVRVFLHVEGIKSKEHSVPYDVYLNLPPDAEPLKYPELYAGRLAMFGLVEASRAEEDKPDNGLHYTLDITELFNRLSAEPGWSPDELRVALVPVRDDGPVGARVGRLSVYFE